MQSNVDDKSVLSESSVDNDLFSAWPPSPSSDWEQVGSPDQSESSTCPLRNRQVPRRNEKEIPDVARTNVENKCQGGMT